jgi:hypothetical protein
MSEFSAALQVHVFVRSDDDERAIGLFENLRDSVDAIPSPLIEATEKLRRAGPESFEKALAHTIKIVRFGFFQRAPLNLLKC